MITGHEYIYPETMTVDQHGNTFLSTHYSSHNGETLRQRALREFMCAITQGIFTVSGGHSFVVDESEIAANATQLTNAYFNELNKQP